MSVCAGLAWLSRDRYVCIPRDKDFIHSNDNADNLTIIYHVGTAMTLFIHFLPIKYGLQACVIFAILLYESGPELIPGTVQ